MPIVAVKRQRECKSQSVWIFKWRIETESGSMVLAKLWVHRPARLRILIHGVGDQEAGRGREEGGEGSVTTRTLTFFWL